MSILRRVLVGMMLVRLLMPPGICACTLASPLARSLADLVREGRLSMPALPPDEADDDHSPGCPASPYAVGMYVKPSPLPAHPPLTFDHPPTAETVAAVAEVPSDLDTPFTPLFPLTRPPGQALYQTHCALII